MADLLLRPNSPSPAAAASPGSEAGRVVGGARPEAFSKNHAAAAAAAAALAYAPLREEEVEEGKESFGLIPEVSLGASLGVPRTSGTSGTSPLGPRIARENHLHRASGTRFYGRVRLVVAEELVHRGDGAMDKAVARRERIALSRRGQSMAKSGGGGGGEHRGGRRASARKGSARTTRGRQDQQQQRRQRQQPGGFSSGRGDVTGARDAYDAYPWSAYYREEVMCLSKVPRPPYFQQLEPGLRPDTVVLRTVPVSWFLDTPEEVAEERAREMRERKVAQFADAKDDDGSASDSPLWFTKHGKILIKAACMRFGPVRRVDLVFEMDSRNEEWTLMFDAYVQFSTFAGFRDAYIAFDGGVLLHAAPPPANHHRPNNASRANNHAKDSVDDNNPANNLQCLELEPEFDTTGHFSDKNCKLRKVRRELAQRKEEQEAHARALQVRKRKKEYREGLEKAQKAVKLMRNDFEDLEYELDRLLQMSKVGSLGSAALASTREREDARFVEGAARARECMDNALDYVACMPDTMPIRGAGLQSVVAALVAAGGEAKEQQMQQRQVERKENPEEEEDEAAAERDEACMPGDGESKDGSASADTGKRAAVRLIATLTGSDIVYEARKRLSQAKKAIKHASREVFKAYTSRTVQVPSLMQVLENRMGTHSRLAELVHRRIRSHGEAYFHGVTLFVPHDRGFGTDTIFDEDCWGTHLLRGPYLARDLYGFASEGTGELLCANGRHHLSAGMNERGEFTVWIDRKGHPRRVVRVEEPDVCVQNGTIVHFVDKVIFPPAY